MEKLYLVDKNSLKIHEDAIIYEYKHKYIAIHDEPTYFGDVVYCEKAEIVTDNGNFKEVFNKAYGCSYGLRNYYVFSTRDLAEQYVKSVKQYGEIWSAERSLEQLKGCMKTIEGDVRDAEERLRKAKEALANGETLLHKQ